MFFLFFIYGSKWHVKAWANIRLRPLSGLQQMISGPFKNVLTWYNMSILVTALHSPYVFMFVYMLCVRVRACAPFCMYACTSVCACECACVHHIIYLLVPVSWIFLRENQDTLANILDPYCRFQESEKWTVLAGNKLPVRQHRCGAAVQPCSSAYGFLSMFSWAICVWGRPASHRKLCCRIKGCETGPAVMM